MTKNILNCHKPTGEDVRRRSFSSRSHLAALAMAQRMAERERVRADRSSFMDARRTAAQARVDYQAGMGAEAQSRTDELEASDCDLRSILSSILDRNFAIDFLHLKQPFVPTPFDAREVQVAEVAPDMLEYLPPDQGLMGKLIPALRDQHALRVKVGTEQYQKALNEYRERDATRIAKLASLRATYEAEYERAQAEVKQANADIDEFSEQYRAHERDAIIEYFTLVFDGDVLPDDLPATIRVTFDGPSKQLVIERELPTTEVIPTESAFKYVKASDKIVSTVRKASERRTQYTEVLAQLAIRTIYIAVKADIAGSFETVAFNGFVDTIDPANGARVRPTLISLTAARSALEAIQYDKVEAAACLRGLRAHVSRSAHDLEPVSPIVAFDMVDKRFVDKGDVLSSLDSRPNLADLKPAEFENLMTNLFGKMGLETRLTQASRDGGVDCVAWDMRPVIGGKVVIQAKRYRNTVGVSAVRDLYGTMMNEGASKGILVTTSGYGDTAYEFVKNKPLQLITGANLLAMLSEYADVDARIAFPTEWIDPN